jgi:Flp pilus assembly protein TadB
MSANRDSGVWLNRARVALVACAAVAAALLAVAGQRFPAALLAVGVAAHAGLWWAMWRQRRGDGTS